MVTSQTVEHILDRRNEESSRFKLLHKITGKVDFQEVYSREIGTNLL